MIVDPADAGDRRGAARGSRCAGADAVLALMDERATDGTEPPRTAGRGAGRAATCSSRRPAGRSATPRRASGPASGRARRDDAGGHRGHARPGDGGRLRRHGRPLQRGRPRCSTEADEAHLTCPRGTRPDASTSPAAPGSPTTAISPRRGRSATCPCGEGFIAPLGGEGTVVAASLARSGCPSEPATLTRRDGRIVAAEGGLGPRVPASCCAPTASAGTNLAELGVGTNERAQLTGNVLEDEKILGTVHVAFGASAGHRRDGVGADPPRRGDPRGDARDRRRARCSTAAAACSSSPSA